ncbi:MAG: ADP-ribosylglycohydrolase family protein [Lewinella sp.]
MKTTMLILLHCSFILLLCTCDRAPSSQAVRESNSQEVISPHQIDRQAYEDKLQGFWLGQCIANWTGLITEMDKIGNVGPIKTGDFYTRDNWGGPDQPNIWSGDTISDISSVIDFVLLPPDTIWGADDDTDIEYMYQHLLYENKTSVLTPEQIGNGWLKHIRPEEENYLWVSNQRAFDLMKADTLPPLTGDPTHNEHHAMIDAQLTTEIFGLFAPGRPGLALKIAHLPIRTSARGEAAEIAEFYVIMYALAHNASADKAGTQSIADAAREHLNNNAYPAKMYDFVKSRYDAGIPWEQCRDEVYQRYQVEQQDGYNITSQNIYCNGCFAAGINFAASLISLFYGEGDLKATIKIGSLCGWDSDNPTATWGGLIGFMLGRQGVEAAFGQKLSDKFWIHRTRQGFPNGGMDDFPSMARRGAVVMERVMAE